MSQYQSLDADVLRTFVAIAEQGGFTRAGEVVNRTQSAVSMQMKRLEEDILQRQLFERDGRQVRLTAEGQVLLGYARRILKLHGEVFNTLRMPHMVGLVRIGTPDDYAMRFLPTILSSFAQAYPLVQVEVHCDSSKQLMLRQDLDLTIVTREPGNEVGQLLRQERLVWAAAEGFLPTGTATDAGGAVQHRLLLPGLDLQCPGSTRYRLPHCLYQPQPGGDLCHCHGRVGRDGAAAKPDYREHPHTG